MRKSFLIPAIVSFAIAAAIVLFGEGLRVLYSGAFFLLIGVILLVNGRRGANRKTA